MNKKIKKRWITALTSGRFKQGTSQLKTDKGSYCCLGVLCELHRLEKNRTRKEKVSWVKTPWESSQYLNEEYILPKQVMSWAGLDREDPQVGVGSLAEHNDGDSGKQINRCRFPKIAKLIEKHL